MWMMRWRGFNRRYNECFLWCVLFLRVTGFGGGGWESGQREECAIGEREECRPGAEPIEREEEVEKECRECRCVLRPPRSSRVRRAQADGRIWIRVLQSSMSDDAGNSPKLSSKI